MRIYRHISNKGFLFESNDRDNWQYRLQTPSNLCNAGTNDKYTNLGFVEYDNVVHAPRAFQRALTLHSMTFVVLQSGKFLLLALICSSGAYAYLILFPSQNTLM